MSVRRLADETLQPAGFAFTAENERWALAKMGEYPAGRQQSAVIPLLMRAQEQEGWVSRAAIETVANMLGMAYIRVLEVATFYTQFQLQPVGSRAHIQVCGTTPCMLRGAESLIAACQHHIHHDPHHLSADGTLSWEEVECLGACVNAPMVAIGRDTYEDLTLERFEEIIEAFRAGRGDTIPPGSQIERQFSAPIGGETTLLEKPGKARAKFVPPEAPSPAAPAPAAAAAAAPAVKPAPAAAPASQGAKEDAKEAQKAQKTSGIAPLFERPAGAPDDLKMISGVGPKLEGELHALGITKFAQIAAFTADDIARVDAVLSFRGRIARDNWTAQAAALAKGGAAEYERVFGKKPR